MPSVEGVEIRSCLSSAAAASAPLTNHESGISTLRIDLLRFLLLSSFSSTTITDLRGNLLAYLPLLNGMMSRAIRVPDFYVGHHSLMRSQIEAPVVNRTF